MRQPYITFLFFKKNGFGGNFLISIFHVETYLNCSLIGLVLTYLISERYSTSIYSYSHLCEMSISIPTWGNIGTWVLRWSRDLIVTSWRFNPNLNLQSLFDRMRKNDCVWTNSQTQSFFLIHSPNIFIHGLIFKANRLISIIECYWLGVKSNLKIVFCVPPPPPPPPLRIVPLRLG